MTEFLTRELIESMDAARKSDRARRNRLRVHVGGEAFTILRAWNGGFAVDAGTAPRLRGRVDLYDGGRHLYHCLIVAGAEEAGEMVYEFKRHTPAVDKVPLDFEQAGPAPLPLPSDT